ncbi:uncharacterized protein N7484_012032 [Penicillium longicatenatum]|uniref:uncharacterized protein n=1 Tax=Penicillium longicatenatum TaxID=1561947 RepID=UPI00254891F4|nr:uncharacterized protein N7484_012032 [Penicillium longicatenatum]KAJ5631932.1 hypothetical protein N7484_012032 [Penicillium longicatenatum]
MVSLSSANQVNLIWSMISHVAFDLCYRAHKVPSKAIYAHTDGLVDYAIVNDLPVGSVAERNLLKLYKQDS